MVKFNRNTYRQPGRQTTGEEAKVNRVISNSFIHHAINYEKKKELSVRYLIGSYLKAFLDAKNYETYETKEDFLFFSGE